MRRLIPLALAAAAATGCAQLPAEVRTDAATARAAIAADLRATRAAFAEGRVTGQAVREGIGYDVDETFRDLPFDAGLDDGITILTHEPHPERRVERGHGPGELRSFSLHRCAADPAAVCGASPHGHRARLSRTLRHYVVEGAYPGTTFLLRPGGSGTLRDRHGERPLAWD
ncbi:MAG: hypothetical protein ACU0BF_00565 [Paracoccaceae bacterium]